MSDAHFSDRKSEPISSDDSHFSQLKMRTNEMDRQDRSLGLPSRPKTAFKWQDAVNTEPVEIGPSINKISYKSVSTSALPLIDIYEIPVPQQGSETTALSQDKVNMVPVEIGPSIKKISHKSVSVPFLPHLTDICGPVPRQGSEMTALSQDKVNTVPVEIGPSFKKISHRSVSVPALPQLTDPVPRQGSEMTALSPDKVNMKPVEIGPSIKKAPHKSDPSVPTSLQVPQLVDVGDISEPREGSEIGGKDGGDRGDSAVLGRIYHQVCRTMVASAHFENDAYPRSPAGVETAVQDLIRAFELAHSNTHKLEEALEAKEKECKSLAQENKEVRGWVKRIQQEHRSEKKITTESHQREKERLENELELLDKQHRERVLIIEGSTKQLRSEFYDEKAKLSSTVESQKYTFETRLTALRIDSENDKQRMTAEHQAKKDEMMKMFDEEKTSMRKELQRLNDQFHKELRNLQDQHSQELYKKDREVEEARRKQEVEEKRLEEQNAANKLRLEKKREEEYKKLKGDVDALRGAMVNGAHFKAMSDRELVPRFRDIASEIDDFSRVRWDNRRAATWPFPESVLRKSENERRSKQYVVQNTIWVILYERIFCTPFRVLGAQGRLMERDWIEYYGQGELSRAPNKFVRSDN